MSLFNKLFGKKEQDEEASRFTSIPTIEEKIDQIWVRITYIEETIQATQEEIMKEINNTKKQSEWTRGYAETIQESVINLSKAVYGAKLALKKPKKTKRKKK